ncbi:MAG: aminoglycoside phosphotransferase family protein [Actinomycetota bacterium]
MKLGSLVGVGRTADVYAYGDDSVVKVLRADIPRHWAALEAQFTAAVHARGLPTPEVRDLTEIDGRPAVVFERIDGPSMWNEMAQSDASAAALAKVLGRMHAELQAELAPAELPALAERVAEKTSVAGALNSAERTEAGAIARRLETAPALCHGDLHPGNVLMSSRGPIMIDWYDAAAGPWIADVVRTSLLVRPLLSNDNPHHLPGASQEQLAVVHRHYLEQVLTGHRVHPDLVRAWEAVLAAGRLAEKAEPDDAPLIALWRNRDEPDASPLLRDLRSLAVLQHAAE